jgi:catechol 2,3-dioxygenase-like lactoylglutathione lyase family enzyme
MLTRIDHIEFVVKDVEALVTFYKKLGFQEILRSTHHRLSVEIQLPGPNQPIYEIHEAESAEREGIEHIAFLVDDMDKTYNELQAKGVKFLREPHLVPASGRVLANARDPEGFKVQLVSAKREEPKAGGIGTRPFEGH